MSSMYNQPTEYNREQDEGSHIEVMVVYKGRNQINGSVEDGIFLLTVP